MLVIYYPVVELVRGIITGGRPSRSPLIRALASSLPLFSKVLVSLKGVVSNESYSLFSLAAACGLPQCLHGLLLLCAFPASAQTLHLVTEEWPGLINDTPQGPSGVLWEVSRKVLENMGYELKLEFVPWKRAQRLVLGRIDAMLANRDVISIQAERLGVADRLSASEKSVSGGPVYLAFSPETPDGFLAAFSDALKHYKNSEDYAVGGLR